MIVEKNPDTFATPTPQRIPSWLSHYSRMDWVIVGALLASGMLGLVIVLVSLWEEYRYRQPREEGRDCPAAQEEDWYSDEANDLIPCCRRPFWSLLRSKVSLPKIDCRHHSLPRFYPHSE